MTKYFKDERELNFRVTRIDVAQLSAESIAHCFNSGDECSICITFSGFEESCLGYVVHVRKLVNDFFELVNITGETEMRVNGVEALILVLRHVCGETYSPAIQDVFQQIRCDIGNTTRNAIFAIPA